MDDRVATSNSTVAGSNPAGGAPTARRWRTASAPAIGRLAVRDFGAAILDRFYEHLTDEKGLSPSSERKTSS